jgi:hypothetical protein
VNVFSTGLSKRSAKIIRASQRSQLSELHPQDLKWRSLEELKRGSEFDLILSSNGELFYDTKPNHLSIKPEPENPKQVSIKLKKILEKSNDGGIASFSPVVNIKRLKLILKRLTQDLGLKYDIYCICLPAKSSDQHRLYQVLIRKKASLWKLRLSHFLELIKPVDA